MPSKKEKDSGNSTSCKSKSLRIVVLGSSAVGKSAIVSIHNKNLFHTYFNNDNTIFRSCNMSVESL